LLNTYSHSPQEFSAARFSTEWADSPLQCLHSPLLDGFSLDAVYTGKMFYGLFKLIETKTFKRGTTIIALHSGGLQGNAGYRFKL